MRRFLLLLGVTCLVGQALAWRELLVACAGNPFAYVAALTAALLFGAIGVGWIGRSAQQWNWGVPALTSLLATGGLLAPLTVLLARYSAAYPPPNEGFIALAAMVVLAPLSFATGSLYAVACAVSARSGEPPALAIRRVGGFVALGAALGGMAVSWLLTGTIDALTLALALASLDVMAAFVIWWNGPREEHRWGWALLPLGLLLLTCLATPAPKVLDLLSQTPPFGAKLVLKTSTDTSYGRLQVAEAEGQAVFAFDGNLLVKDTPPETKAYLPLLAHPAPRRVLIIGGAADGVVAKALDLPWLQVDYVGIDPALLPIERQWAASGNRAALENLRVTTYSAMDVRLFLKHVRGRYDVIILNAPQWVAGPLNRLNTVEFFAEARQSLAPGGILALHLASPTTNMAAGTYVTLRAAFPVTAVFAGGGSSVHYLASGSRSVTFSDAALWPQRMRAWRLKPTVLTEGALAVMTRPGRNAAIMASFREARPLVNSDLRPAPPYRELRRFVDSCRVGRVDLLGWALRLDFWTALLALVVITGLLAIAVVVARAPLRVGVPVAQGYAGASAAALWTVLLLGFQGMYGTAYGQLGVILGMAALGMAIGAAAAARIPTGRPDLRLLLLLQMGLAALAALTIPLLLLIDRGSVGIWRTGELAVIPLLSLCIGLHFGAHYPIAAALSNSGSAEPSAPANSLARQMLGGAVGTLIVGTIVIPVLGFIQTCWLLAALALAPIPLLLLSARKPPAQTNRTYGIPLHQSSSGYPFPTIPPKQP